ncbi:MAG: hypothetical protein ACSLFB_09780 [Acidimicrobiales bacterium]
MPTFVQANREEFGVDPICAVLQVASRTIRAHSKRAPERGFGMNVLRPHWMKINSSLLAERLRASSPACPAARSMGKAIRNAGRARAGRRGCSQRPSAPRGAQNSVLGR